MKGEGNTTNQKGKSMKTFMNTALRIGPIVIDNVAEMYDLRNRLDETIEACEAELEMNERMWEIIHLMNEFAKDYGPYSITAEDPKGTIWNFRVHEDDKLTIHD